MENEKIRKNQILTLEERTRLSVSAVENIESFSDEEIVLKTETGRLQIGGKGLKLEDLSVENGNAALTGRIDLMRFTQTKEKQSLLAGLFK